MPPELFIFFIEAVVAKVEDFPADAKPPNSSSSQSLGVMVVFLDALTGDC